MKAKKKQLDANQLQILAYQLHSKTSFIKMFVPVSDSKAEIIQGAPAEAAAKLLIN
jgi:electron transfer flavoprotein alpha/beta subunit